MSNCCPSNGAAWDTPVPAPTTLVPAGTQVLATPIAYGGCGCSSGAASAVTGGAPAVATGSLGTVHPLLRQAAEVPAVGAVFQAYATGASQWAVAGMQVWFPPFGYAEITGVTGDLMALKNLTLPPGMVLQTGTALIALPPPVPVVVAPVVAAPSLVLLETPLLIHQIASTPAGTEPMVTGSHALAGKSVAWLQGQAFTGANDADLTSAESYAEIEVNGRVYLQIISHGGSNSYHFDVGVFPVRVMDGQITYKLSTKDNTMVGDSSAYVRLFLLGSQ